MCKGGSVRLLDQTVVSPNAENSTCPGRVPRPEEPVSTNVADAVREVTVAMRLANSSLATYGFAKLWPFSVVSASVESR